MKPAINKLQEIWDADLNRGILGTENKHITFDDLANAITSTGDFYFYVIDFSDYSLSHVSESIEIMLGFDAEKVTFQNLLNVFHPDDMDFIFKTEAFVSDFFYKNIHPTKLLSYKTSFNFRIKLKNGDYNLFNHQALMLTLGPNGGLGKCLNIHTNINHLNSINNFQISFIGLNNEPSYLNLKLNKEIGNEPGFSDKEIEIITCIADGLSTIEISEKMFLSPETIKTHRANIIKKSGLKKMSAVVKYCYIQGLITLKK